VSIVSLCGASQREPTIGNEQKDTVRVLNTTFRIPKWHPVRSTIIQNYNRFNLSNPKLYKKKIREKRADQKFFLAQIAFPR
jgi:hypothetical protein